MKTPTRRLILTTTLASTSLFTRPAFSASDDVEDRLLAMLAGSGSGDVFSTSNSYIENLVKTLEKDGGTQHDSCFDEGAFGPWIGAWSIRYADSFQGGPLNSLRGMKLLSARQFVNGPPNAKEELKGKFQDGGIATECVYGEADGRRRILLSRSGSLIKLPAFAYRLDFAKPAAAYEFDENGDGSPGRLAPLSDASLGLDRLPGGATLREISYLSERVWISRSSDDGALVVAERSDARALAPSTKANAPDLSSTCAETGWQSGSGLCRRQALF